jgi:hypothetical protein
MVSTLVTPVVAVVGVGVDVPPHAASMIAAASAKVRALIT